MQKMTLLQMVQNILSAMNSDDVNSISDTVESLQVANEIKTTFFELYGNRDIATFESLVNLESPGSAATPHLLKVPSTVSYLRWLKYRDYDATNEILYKDLQYLEPEDFIKRIVEQSESSSGLYQSVTLTATSPVTFPIRKDRCPSYFTLFDDDQTIVCDAYDADNESWLTGANSLAWGVLYKSFDLTDDFVPPIDAHLFPHFLHECRSVCFINIKEVANSKEEQRARRQLVRSQTRLGDVAAQKRGVFSKHDYSRKR